MEKEIKFTRAKVVVLEESLINCPEAQRAIRNTFPEAFKKEVHWVDITESLEFRPYRAGNYYWIAIHEKGNPTHLGWLDASGAKICTHEKGNYRVERQGEGHSDWANYFRILKRV